MPGTWATEPDPEITILFSASDAVSNILGQIDTLLALSSSQLSTEGLEGEKATAVLSDLVSVSSVPGILSVVTVDPEGVIRAVSPTKYADIIGMNISYQSHIVEALRTKQPVRSDYFKAVEGFDAVTRSYPVFSKENEYLGMVILVYNPGLLYETTLNPILNGTSCTICIVSSDGMILYSSDRSLQYQTNIIIDYPQSSDLQETGENMTRSYAGSSSYTVQSDSESYKPDSYDIIWNTIDNQIIGIISHN